VGIDVYLRYQGMTEAEKKRQYTGFSVQHGHVGYLREAYHGGPYATKALVPETWHESAQDERTLDERNKLGIYPLLDQDGTFLGLHFPAALLRQRLPAAIDAAVRRQVEIYDMDPTEAALSPRVLSLRSFVELAEQ
jgi:hypothetical protein